MLLSAALALRPGRTVILSEAGNFPTDLYMAEGLQTLLGPGRCELRRPAAERILEGLGDDVAVLMLTHVDFRTGRRHNMKAIARAAHEAGALVLWDLAGEDEFQKIQLSYLRGSAGYILVVDGSIPDSTRMPTGRYQDPEHDAIVDIFRFDAAAVTHGDQSCNVQAQTEVPGILSAANGNHRVEHLCSHPFG